MVILSAYSRSLPTGSPEAMRGHNDSQGFQEPGEVKRGGLPLTEVGLVATIIILNFMLFQPGDQVFEPDFFRAYPVERRNRAMQNMVLSPETARFLY